MRLTVALLLTGLTVFPGAVAGQKRPSIASAIDRVSIEATADPAEVKPGENAVLRVNVKPDKGISVFAPGAKDFTSVLAMVMKPKGIKSMRPSFLTPPQKGKNPGNKKDVPLYKQSFRVDHVVTIAEDAKPGTDIMVTGSVTYQTFDDKNVYPRRTMPVRWTIHVVEP
ncbi:MAG TPA: hypothetical protein VM032_13450 [Vicinamibacterales bacterium]|nr:hypothetical protein [Vicinamibacterales bacterium]